MTVHQTLSAAQQRIWFLQQLRPSDPAYNIVNAVELTGPAAPAALAAAVNGIMARHSLLRARFGLRANRPVQLAPADGPTPVPLIDLSGLAAGRRDDQLGRLLRAVAARPFDLRTGPVANWSLLRLAPDRHVLVFAVHHIVFDGGSLWVACRELEQRYPASGAGRPPRLSALGQPAGATRSQPPATTDLAYWRTRLAGAPPRLRVLPSAGPGLPDQPDAAAEGGPVGVEASEVTIQLGSERAAELRAFARRLRCTPFMTLLAVFGGLLLRYTGQPDLVVGTPVSTRDTESSRSMIGLFLNMLPLRLDLGGDPSLGESLPRVREVVLDAFTHRSVPFERLVDELRPPRALDYPPLFQVVFAYQESPAAPALPELGTRLLSVDAAAAKYDLTVIATDTGDDLEITVQAGPTSDPSAPQLFAANFDVLLAGSLHDPARPLSRLPLLAPPMPQSGPPPAESTYEPGGRAPVRPGSAKEQAVAAAWCATLGVSEVDAHQSFFDLGGSSLLLLELHARLLAEVSDALTLADLFRFPTVASLAAYLAAGGEQASPDAAGGGAGPSLAAGAARGALRRGAVVGRRREGGAT